MVIWIIGRPGSGKTTFGRMLRELIGNAVLLDGDELRAAVDFREFTKEGRDKWVMTVAGTAEVLEKEGKVPIVCLVSPYSEIRTKARSKFKKSIMFYMKADGDEDNMWPGSEYEEPLAKEHAFEVRKPALPKDLIKALTGRQPQKKAFRVV